MTTQERPRRSVLGAKNSHRILIIEEDHGYAELIRDILSSVGYKPTLAATAAEGLARLAQEPHQLAVLEVGEPISEGIHLARQIRRRDKDIGLTFTSQRPLGVTETASIYEAGADELVVKPFHPAVFAMRVTAVLRRVQSTRGTVLVEDSSSEAGLVLAEADQLASFDGTPLPLTKTEYLLLRELHRRRGDVVPNSMLEARVLGRIDDGRGALRGHVSLLRQKLFNAGANRELVRTVRGVGYYLDA